MDTLCPPWFYIVWSRSWWKAIVCARGGPNKTAQLAYKRSPPSRSSKYSAERVGVLSRNYGNCKFTLHANIASVYVQNFFAAIKILKKNDQATHYSQQSSAEVRFVPEKETTWILVRQAWYHSPDGLPVKIIDMDPGPTSLVPFLWGVEVFPTLSLVTNLCHSA